MMKVMLITNIPTPYRIPLFNELHKQLREAGLTFKVVFAAMGYDRRRWKVDMTDCSFDYVVLPSGTIPFLDQEKTSFTYPGLLKLISRENPAVIITNGFSLATVKLWAYSWIKNISYIIWSGAISRKGMDDTVLRRLQRKILVRRADGFIAYGTKAKEYLGSLGAGIDRICIGINSVDTRFFQEETKKLRLSGSADNGKKHLLYIGHLTKGKRLDRLLEALKCLSERRRDFLLEIVGDGPEAENLKQHAVVTGIADLVRFEGFKQKKDIPYYFAHADCFVFPSEYDVWGLVLVEAMAAGVPCIASVHAGATSDLVEDGVTGFKVDFSNGSEVADRINLILGDKAFSGKFGMNSSNFIQKNATIEISAKGFVTAIQQTLSVSNNKGGL